MTLLIFITNTPQTFKVNEYIECSYDGRFIQTKLNGEIVLSQPAKLGNAFYLVPQGQKKPPLLTRAELPTTRGAKIAWALSFIGDEKMMNSQADFYTTYDILVKEDIIRNIALTTKYGSYAIAIADKHIINVKQPEKSKVKKNNPVLAWIADDISYEDLNHLLDEYAKRRSLPCPKEFFFLL